MLIEIVWIRRELLTLSSLTLFLASCAIPKPYAADPTEAWVVDKDTGEPLEGVIVIAEWTTRGGNIEASGTGYLEVMEIVTDKNGRFEFPGWGTKWAGLIRDVAFVLFKDGYNWQGFSNFTEIKFPVEWGITKLNSRWNGKQLPFEKFKGTRDAYISDVLDFSNMTVRPIANRTCSWKKIPQILIILTKLKQAFLREKGELTPTISSIVDVTYPLKDCGNPELLFKGALK